MSATHAATVAGATAESSRESSIRESYKSISSIVEKLLFQRGGSPPTIVLTARSTSALHEFDTDEDL